MYRPLIFCINVKASWWHGLALRRFWCGFPCRCIWDIHNSSRWDCWPLTSSQKEEKPDSDLSVFNGKCNQYETSNAEWCLLYSMWPWRWNQIWYCIIWIMIDILLCRYDTVCLFMNNPEVPAEPVLSLAKSLSAHLLEVLSQRSKSYANQLNEVSTELSSQLFLRKSFSTTRYRREGSSLSWWKKWRTQQPQFPEPPWHPVLISTRVESGNQFSEPSRSATTNKKLAPAEGDWVDCFLHLHPYPWSFVKSCAWNQTKQELQEKLQQLRKKIFPGQTVNFAAPRNFPFFLLRLFSFLSKGGKLSLSNRDPPWHTPRCIDLRHLRLTLATCMATSLLLTSGWYS